MFDLIHNIDFVIASIFILLIIYLSVGRRYINVSASNRMFYRMVNTAMVACVIDIIMNVTETYTDMFPHFIANLSRTAFNVCVGVLTYFAYSYVKAYFASDSLKGLIKVIDVIASFFVAAFIIAGVCNLFVGFISYVDDDGVFRKGYLYSINYIVPVILLSLMLLTAFLSRKFYTKVQFRSIVYFVMIFAGAVNIITQLAK